MRVELLISLSCEPCHEAERVWRDLAAERGLDFAVLDLAEPDGQQLAARLKLKTIPAIVIDGRLQAIGVQDRDQALALIAQPGAS